ncbi:Fc.00g089840.m01.CDS01 [Cosmosporella sp. VM-42]
MAGKFKFDVSQLPQDPFYPQWPPEGPSFLDTGACLCALQPSPAQNHKNAAWQCIGNQTQGVYNTTSGKWFGTLHGGRQVNLPMDDASNGPDTKSPHFLSLKDHFFRNLTHDSLSIYDKACTGVNQTTFSAAFYRAVKELAADKPPVDAAPCWRPGAVPIQIQNVSSWESGGCSEGFLCANNTLNSLPQFCPPITQCQMARLAGEICTFEGKNIGMGPWEPVICQKGYHCPPESNGTETFPCPKGSYCQPGASTPTPCGIGSRCPEGSTYQLFLIPIILLIIIDILLIAGLFLFSFRQRFQKTSQSHLGSLKKHSGMSGVTATITGYKALPDENDHEMVAMDATYMPGRDGWTGFEAALDVSSIYDGGNDQTGSGLTPQLRVFVESMRKATEAMNFGLSFGYSGLSFHPKGSPRPILQNVTGSIERGSLAAVMGGSGAGKSTFVNVLMGKTSHTGGIVSVNNVPGKMQRYKKLTGYVPQDDIVLPELTVYENIVHSARIRLPRTWSNNDIEAHVESVIDCLELSHVRNSLVGSVGKPIISGGQRKRVSIGMELAAAPMAIFLDEPTSGLDATAASSIMRTLKAIARLGISVIVIIHQPRMEIFDMFDNLILLGNGQTIYEGPQRDAEDYFKSVGFHFPDHSNHGDVITDIITGNGREYKKSGDISKDGLISHWATCRQASSPEDNRNTISSASIQKALKKRGAPRYKQTWLCLRRAMLQQYRAKGAFWSEMGLAALAGFLLGLAENGKKGVLFVGHYREPYSILSIATDFKSAPEMSLLVAIAIRLVSGAPGVKIFSEELLLHRREAEAGHSRLAYFLAKAVSVFPRMAFACLHFSTLLFLLSVPIIPWGIAFFANFLYFYCIYGLASCVSMVVRREDAPLFATMISLIVGILSGAAPPLSQVKKWHMEWLWRASPGVWLAELYFGQLVAPLRRLYDVDLASQATGFHIDWLWRNILLLFAIGTVYRIVAFIGIIFGHRLRR